MSTVVVPFPVPSVQLGVAASTLYTCPGGVQARIQQASFLNTNGSDRTATVHVVRSGDTAAANNMIWNAKALLAGKKDGEICYPAIGQVLNPGDTIQALASNATSVTPQGSVVEFS